VSRVARSRQLPVSILVAAVWVAPALFATVDHLAQRRLVGEPWPPLHELLFSGGDWLVYAILTPPIFAVAGRWPIERPYVRSRAVLHLVIAVFFCVAWAVSGKLLQLGIGHVIDTRALEHGLAPRDWVSWIFTTLPFGVVVYFFILGVAHAIRFFEQSRERDVQVARLSEQLAGARFAALEAQVNPHFLFNTLNTIAVRARDGDTTGTVRMVEQLSELLRRTLRRHRSSEVRLDDELDLVRQYLAIEQARFSDRLRPVFDIAEELGAAAVPSFALQHLVENAIRHGIAKRSGAGLIELRARRHDDVLDLTVADDGEGLGERWIPPPGRGVYTTRERLLGLYRDRATLDLAPRAGGGTVARLRVPYREIERSADDGER
jgi:two-component system LytT family sensor kinase